MTEMPQRQYDEDEVRRLFRRATELGRAEPPATRGSGLTLPQLEEIAREADIDVEALRRAALELDAGAGVVPGGRASATVAGGPLVLVLERTLPIEPTPEALEAVIPGIQAAANAPGQASLVGRTLTWQSQSQANPREMQVVIAGRSGHTAVRIEERYGGLAGLIFGTGVGGIGAGVGFGVGVGVGAAIGSVAMAVAFPIATLGATYLGSRALFGHVVGKRRARLGRLLESLAAELMASAGAIPPGQEADNQLPGSGGED